MAGADEDDPDELDRPLGRRRRPVPRRRARHRHPRLHDASGHAVRSDLLRARTRAPAGRQAGERRGARVRPAGRHPVGGGAPDEGQGRRLHGPLRRQPGQRRADPGLGRRLRPDGLRHRRDHGRARARRARPRVCAPERPAGAPGDRRGDERPDRLRRLHRAAGGGSQGEDRASGCASRAGVRRRSATGCATGRSHASATGGARSRSSTARTTASSPFPTRTCPFCCPRSRTTGRRASRRSPPTRSG